MMKTSYHIEKPLFIPVKDDQITGIPSIESGVSQTIVEDIDILGDNISSENNDIMLGVTNFCPNDTCLNDTCYNDTCLADNPIIQTGCTMGLTTCSTNVNTNLPDGTINPS